MTELQNKILELGVEFKRVCEENNLRYYLFYGTFLGAVRHKGFIPWDDDLDFAMPRPDYEKFLKIAKEKLNPQKIIIGGVFMRSKDLLLPHALKVIEKENPYLARGRDKFLIIQYRLTCSKPCNRSVRFLSQEYGSRSYLNR